MFKCDDFKKVMEHSGLTGKELAKLMGTTRQTLYAWRDRAPTQPTLAERAEKYTEGLLKAINAGVLPLPKSLSPDQRRTRLNVMARGLHALTAPK